MTQAAFLIGPEREAVHKRIFQEFHNSKPVQELMKAKDGSFYANFVFTYSFVALDLWIVLTRVSGPMGAIATGIFSGILFGWIGMLGHDVGHNQAPKGNTALRLAFQLFLGPVSLGFSSLWWVAKHVTHHLYSNWEKHDGDLNLPLPFTANQAIERGLSPNSFRIKHARWIFPSILPLQALNARWSSIKYILKTKHRLWLRVAECAGIILHLVLYGSLLFTLGVHAGWYSSVLFFFFHQCTHGVYNSSVFAPNHKGMITFLAEMVPTWLDRQILTSRNVKIDWKIFHTKYGWILERVIDTISTWMQGALNYQIEHHLFPTMPRCNLRKVRPLVQEFCRIHGFEYYETGFWKAVNEVLDNFDTVRLDLLDSPMGA